MLLLLVRLLLRAVADDMVVGSIGTTADVLRAFALLRALMADNMVASAGVTPRSRSNLASGPAGTLAGACCNAGSHQSSGK